MPLFDRLKDMLSTTRQYGLVPAGWYAFYKAGLVSGLWARLTPPGVSSATNPLKATFPLPPPSPQALQSVMGVQAQAQLIAEADEICRGQIRRYGDLPVPLNLCPAEPLHHWSAYERDAASWQTEDVKDIWEPARWGWALTLARAYILTHKEAYAACFWENFETFTRANPPNLGPNWTSGQEVAIRLVVWAWVDASLAGSFASTPARRQALAQALFDHAQRIPPTLSYARAQQNNHSLSELLGLYVASLTLKDWKPARLWQRRARQELEKTLLEQITPEGIYIQHSTNYHRLMLQLALLACAITRAQAPAGRPLAPGTEFSPAVMQRLAAATRWLWARTDPGSGRVLNLGNNDGAYLFPLADGGFEDVRPVVQAAACQFLGCQAFETGPWDEFLLWLGLPLKKTPPPAPPTEATLLRPTPETWGSLRAVHFDHRPAHADQLHVDLWWRGQPLCLDAGTYRYHAAPPWENALVHTGVHNTLTINHLDQMRRAGLFRWLDWAQAKILASTPYEVWAEHDGYRALGLKHRRCLRFIPPCTWQVNDEICEQASNTHPLTVCLHWLLPDVPWTLQGNVLELELNAANRVQITIETAGPAPFEFQVVRAGLSLTGPFEAPPTSGWYSPTYGSLLPALSLRCQVIQPVPIRLSSTFKLISAPEER